MQLLLSYTSSMPSPAAVAMTDGSYITRFAQLMLRFSGEMGALLAAEELPPLLLALECLSTSYKSCQKGDSGPIERAKEEFVARYAIVRDFSSSAPARRG